MRLILPLEMMCIGGETGKKGLQLAAGLFKTCLKSNGPVSNDAAFIEMPLPHAWYLAVVDDASSPE